MTVEPKTSEQNVMEAAGPIGPASAVGQAFSEQPLAERLVTGLAKIGLATRHRAWAEAEGRGLTPTQGQILALLRIHAAGMRISDLAQQLAITMATTTVVVQALERKGLVEKRRAADDGRARCILLTASGRREAEQAAGWSDFLLSAVDDLQPEEQEVFYRGLLKMIRGLQLRGEIPTAHMCLTCRYFRPRVHDDPRAPHHCDFVNAPFGDRHLRLECLDHQTAPTADAAATWERFTAAG